MYIRFKCDSLDELIDALHYCAYVNRKPEVVRFVRQYMHHPSEVYLW
ncbi:unnamed protein product, partial [marine sediment metagenome]